MPLLEALYDLLPEPVATPATGSTHAVVIDSPAPWHPEAGPVLYLISEEARRLEASMRRDVTGRLGERRGGSDRNTVAALRAIEQLAHAVPEERARAACRIIARWIRSARQVADIGLEERAVPLPRLPGQLPPPCPYCGTYSLRVLVGDGRIWCINRTCEDQNGHRPRGHLDQGRQEGGITWADGRTTYRRDWA
ncbi:hypothetical protein [Nonomuraea sp. NPDC050310]|uniref:hypothetical protein n=1 Tax=Nonomuraea sp. NPDC050310 TaxID=3154935 RepID=UPI0033F6C264